jgi:membrane-associated phospholipid phosphatase
MSSLQAGAQRPRQAIWRRAFFREVLILVIAYMVYAQVRGLAADRTADAFRNAYNIINLERDIGIFWELAVQAAVLPQTTLVHFFNLFYFYGFFPLLIPTAVWLFWKRPHVYILTRNAFLISGGIAVIFFLLLPTAPPRLIGMGFVDTLGRSLTPTHESLPGVNQFAALPSMHVGWNFLMALALYLALKNFQLRWLVFLLPAMMLTATVVTGNHYFVDGLLGVVVAFSGFRLAVYIRDHPPRVRALRSVLTSPERQELEELGAELSVVVQEVGRDAVPAEDPGPLPRGGR